MKDLTREKVRVLIHWKDWRLKRTDLKSRVSYNCIKQFETTDLKNGGREKETTTILYKYSLSKITKTNLSSGRKLKRKYKLKKKTKQIKINIEDKKRRRRIKKKKTLVQDLHIR